MNISKKTKIVCTIGPSSDNYETCKQLYYAGMNCMRLNFSHGTHEEHATKLAIAERLEKEDNILVPVMLDTRGPEIRTHNFENGSATIETDSIITISMNEVLGNSTHFSVNYPNLYDDMEVGQHIKVDDGSLTLQIIEKNKENRELICKALNRHTVKNRRGINCPETEINMDYISKKDYDDLVWGCSQRFSYIAASFVRNADDILQIRKILTDNNRPDIKIIAKIENPIAVKNLDEILKVTDAVMVARGDLGVEIPAEEVPIVQKEIIKKCIAANKPVITATQMLDSMKNNPNPTRAEVSDVANAVFESTDCVMLSAETANGEYPILAAETQAKISSRIESYINYSGNIISSINRMIEISKKDLSVSDALATSVVQTATMLSTKLIVVFSTSLEPAKLLSRNRPCCPILFVTDNKKEALESCLYWGVQPLVLPELPQFIEEMEVIALLNAKRINLPAGSKMIITGAIPTGAKNNNFMKVIQINTSKEIDL